MEDFEKGYKRQIDSCSEIVATEIPKSYVTEINDRVQEFNNAINKYKGYKTSANKLKGNVAEMEHAYTHDINAAIKDKKIRMIVPESRVLGSEDIISKDNDYKAGLKYYKTPEETLKQQSKKYYQRYKDYISRTKKDISYEEYLKMNNLSDIDPNTLLYGNQDRIVPKEQYPKIKELLEKAIKDEQDPEVAKEHQEILKRLTDRIKSSDNTESIPLSTEDAIKIAELAKEGEFDAKDFDLFKIDNLVKFKDIARKSAKTAMSAAALSVILDLIPDVYKLICEKINAEEIDSEEFIKMGINSFQVGTRAYIRGFVSAGITTSCLIGKFGKEMTQVNPDCIAMITVIILNSIEKGFHLYKKEITKEEFVDSVLNDAFVSCGYLVGKTVGEIAGKWLVEKVISNVIGKALCSIIPVIGIFAGSILGSMIGSLFYKQASRFCMALCVNKGFTMFGLVKQDYTLPPEIAKELADIIEYEKFEPEVITLEYFQPDVMPVYETAPDVIEIKFVRRGVISIGKVGYIQ